MTNTGVVIFVVAFVIFLLCYFGSNSNLEGVTTTQGGGGGMGGGGGGQAGSRDSDDDRTLQQLSEPVQCHHSVQLQLGGAGEREADHPQSARAVGGDCG